MFINANVHIFVRAYMYITFICTLQCVYIPFFEVISDAKQVNINNKNYIEVKSTTSGNHYLFINFHLYMIRALSMLEYNI